ncbi:MAG TPA: tetratricopeptide repeat protein [Thermoanaerobaculia bacterium]|nr:tetratricopeptide repeat protein [Thermoanaerobaculia bacterium]
MKVSPTYLVSLVFLIVVACSAERQETVDRGPGAVAPRRAPIEINLDVEDPPIPTETRSAEFQAGKLAMKRKDYETAIGHFRSAAEAGEAAAQTNLGVMILNGYGTSEPRQNAEVWFLKAAQQNDDYAQLNLGLLYLQGAIPRDCSAALTWLHKAAESAVPEAGFELGRLYYFGECVPKDREKSAAWRLRAAELGHAGAQVRLAGMYARGDGMPRDPDQQVKWLSKAAENQDPEALWLFGFMLQSGRGVVAKDEPRGIDLLLKAHDQGNPCATIYLAICFYEGAGGVPQDEDRARMLLQSPAITPAQRDVVQRIDFSNPTSRSRSERELSDLLESLDCW